MTDDTLAEAFAELSREVPEPWQLSGVTFHGRDQGWVAFTYNNDTGEFGPEGWGNSAVDAIADLATKLGEMR